MAGLNLARQSEIYKYVQLFETGSYKNKPCIFISYHHSDMEVAGKIASYLTEVLDINIYFDDLDQELKRVVIMNDDKGITEAINKGIEKSMDIL